MTQREPELPAAAAPTGTVWLWYLAGAEIALAASSLSARKALSSAEWHRHDQLRVEADQTRFISARILLRSMLARFAGTPASAWVFQTNKNGRPMVAEPESQSDLRFSITHTDGLVACAVANGFDVGVDAEAHNRATDFLAVAARFFAPPEIDDLLAARPSDQAPMFYDQWTLKESFIKAIGEGLAAPLDLFAFDLRGSSPQISFTDKVFDHTGRWHFSLWRLTGAHSMALAIRRPASDNVTIDVVAMTADALKSG